jgi:hypothetical protein
VEIGIEAAQFPEKEYIKGIFVAVSTEAPKAGHVDFEEFANNCWETFFPILIFASYTNIKHSDGKIS